MESNLLNNKYPIYYLFHEYLINTQFNIYWMKIARVCFEKLLLLKIRVIIKLFPFEPLLAGIGGCMHYVRPSSKNNGLESHSSFYSIVSCRPVYLWSCIIGMENRRTTSPQLPSDIGAIKLRKAHFWSKSHVYAIYFLEIKRVKIISHVRSFTFYGPGPGPTTAILPLSRVKKC